jgi:uncharacterized protein with HEPN domain
VTSSTTLTRSKFSPHDSTFRLSARTERRFTPLRALEIVSEASRRLPDELTDRHPEIGWDAIAAAGNVYRHEYDAVDEALIWHTVRHGLAALRGVAAEEFDRLQSTR